MRGFVLAALAVLVMGCPAWAQNQGEALFQCVTVKWDAPTTYPPSVRVQAWVFGRAVAEKTLTMRDKALEFAFEDGYLAAKGVVSVSFVPYDGAGVLRLDALETSCDFSGSFPVSPRKLADIEFEAKFDY